MKRNLRVIFSIAICIILATLGIVIGVYTVIANNIVEQNTLNTISELALHDKNTIYMFLNYNWRNLERIGSRLKRYADGLENTQAVNEYLGNEAFESTFDKVYLLLNDGSYYTDTDYCVRGGEHFFDFSSVVPSGKKTNAALAGLPDMTESKVVVYSCRLMNELAGITVENGTKTVDAVIGIVRRSSLRDGLVIESFIGEEGNALGHSSVINERGDYIVNSTDNESGEVDNWFKHIDVCEASGMSTAQVKESMEKREAFWFYHKDGGGREVNYCVPLGGSSSWYFLLSVKDEALAEQSTAIVVMIIIALSITVFVTLVAMTIVMVALNHSIKAHAQEKVQGEFLANMSHEMRTPLNGIVGLNYLMLKSFDDDTKRDQFKEWLQKSHSTAKYLLSLINDVLDVSKLRSGKVDVVKEPLSIEAVVDAIYSMQCDNIKNRGINYQSDVKLEAPWILGDEVRIKQVLMNIISNAAKFTPAGGTIKLSVTQEKTDDSHVITTFVCEDTGCGMSKEFLSKIFDAFTQDRNSHRNSTKGTGLGMAISKMLVTAMGGTIAAASELGRGSRFTVIIPAQISDIPHYIEYNVDEEAERMADDVVTEEKPFKILIAEDNELNAEILVEILESTGFSVVRASDGALTVKAFEESQVGEFDLILMDMRMPVLDGCEASKRIRALDRADAHTVPIFACTANTFNEDRIKAYESGMNDFLTKPIDVKVLLQKMEHLEREKKDKKN